MDMEEELPTFRPFTREELATIENRIFENKLEAKKKQEQRDKNIAVRKSAIPNNRGGLNKQEAENIHPIRRVERNFQFIA